MCAGWATTLNWVAIFGFNLSGLILLKAGDTWPLEKHWQWEFLRGLSYLRPVLLLGHLSRCTRFHDIRRRVWKTDARCGALLWIFCRAGRIQVHGAASSRLFIRIIADVLERHSGVSQRHFLSALRLLPHPSLFAAFSDLSISPFIFLPTFIQQRRGCAAWSLCLSRRRRGIYLNFALCAPRLVTRRWGVGVGWGNSDAAGGGVSSVRALQSVRWH